MSRIAVHINDAGITVLSGDRISYREPGFALLDDDQLRTGNDAFRQARIHPRRIQHRFWSNLSMDPLQDRRFRHLTAADLVSRQIEQLWQQRTADADGMVVAVPSYMKPENLGLFLGIAGELNIPVVALVDAAVAATRREYRQAVPVHIEMSLHTTTLTRLAQPGQAQIERSEVIDSSGVYQLYETWINAVAEAFVQQSRFDPLHTAETEQILLNRLGGWLTDASSHQEFRGRPDVGGGGERKGRR